MHYDYKVTTLTDAFSVLTLVASCLASPTDYAHLSSGVQLQARIQGDEGVMALSSSIAVNVSNLGYLLRPC